MICQFTLFVYELGREQPGLVQPGEKYVVAFPQVQGGQFAVVYPLQVPLRGVMEIPCEIAGSEYEHVPVVVFVEGGKGQKAFKHRANDQKSAFFPDLADHAFLRGLAGMELPAQSVPFAEMHVVRPLDAVHHQGLSVAAKVA